MGAIGRWIDERCKAEPDVMRRVLNRKFGDLAAYIGADGRCGCLVGSWLLEGAPMKRGEPGWMKWVGAKLWDCPAERVGIRVMELTEFQGTSRPMWLSKRPDAFVIRLLKQRIRKALGLAPVRGIERGSGVPTPQEQPQP